MRDIKWYNSIKLKLLGFFLVVSIVFLCTIITTFYFIKESNLEQNAKTATTLATNDILDYIRDTQIKAEKIVLILASVTKEELDDKEINQKVISSILSIDKKKRIDIVSGGVWFEPYIADKSTKDKMLFFNRNSNNELKLIENYSSQTNYRDMDFYILAKKTKNNSVSWTNVYVDPVTHITMITAVSPIYKNNTFIGTASLDIKIEDYKNSWSNIELQNMYIMMTDKEGNFIRKSTNLNAYIEQSNIYKLNNSKFKEIVQEIKPTLTHTIKDNIENRLLNKIYFIKNDPLFHDKSIVSVYNFSRTNWNIIIGIPEDKVMAQSNETFKKVLILVVLLTLFATIFGYFLLHKLFARPIESLNKQLHDFSAENEEHYKLLECSDKGEIGLLVENLNARSIALRESQESEAKEIQKRLQNEKMLLQQSKMAAMGEMMDAVAHQWKQPLNALSMYSEIIRSDFEDGTVDQKYIDQFKDDMQVQIDHMVNTLDEFRTFFRPNKEHEKFSLLDIVESVLFLTKDDLLKNRINVKVQQKDPITIDGSSNEFKHLVLNIINNAKDAFNDNHIEKREIIIRLINNQEDGKQMQIEDNAGGIPKDIIDDIFKANVTSKEEGKGTGIGLYMSTQIATKHHATLSVENKNAGASFSVKFS
jgi:signal transduction histidine kinase